jgi:hypothetical protein
MMDLHFFEERMRTKSLIYPFLSISLFIADPTADIKELGKMVESEGIKIPWSLISKRMNKRSRLSCFKKWQKMTGLFSPSDIYKQPPEKEDPATSTQQHRATSTAIPTSSLKSPPAAHAHYTAPTAGAAAALAAAAGGSVNNPVTAGDSADFDLYLLSELVSLGVTRSSEVNWDGLRLENAQERWNELVEEWLDTNVNDESLITLPLSEMAQTMLEQKTSAQRAAEMVEAVDLPPPETLHTREV